MFIKIIFTFCFMVSSGFSFNQPKSPAGLQYYRRQRANVPEELLTNMLKRSKAKGKSEWYPKLLGKHFLTKKIIS